VSRYCVSIVLSKNKDSGVDLVSSLSICHANSGEEAIGKMIKDIMAEYPSFQIAINPGFLEIEDLKDE